MSTACAKLPSRPTPTQVINRDETRTATRKAGQMEGAAPYPAAPAGDMPPRTVTAAVA